MRQLKTDQCVHIMNKNTDNLIIIATYVDDIIVMRKNESAKDILASSLMKEFKMKSLGTADFFLGLRITHNLIKDICWKCLI